MGVNATITTNNNVLFGDTEQCTIYAIANLQTDGSDSVLIGLPGGQAQLIISDEGGDDVLISVRMQGGGNANSKRVVVPKGRHIISAVFDFLESGDDQTRLRINGSSAGVTQYEGDNAVGPIPDSIINGHLAGGSPATGDSPEGFLIFNTAHDTTRLEATEAKLNELHQVY